MNSNSPNTIDRRSWPRRMVILLPIIAFTLLLSGGVYELWSARRDRQLHPPPGKLVSVGSHRLHLRQLGQQHDPTVIFEAGAGGTSLDWHHIQEALADEAHVCAYDRAGFGWSEPGPKPRTGERIVAELRKLLENAGIEPPYILVGHSFGGLPMQLFAAQHPDEVVGLVLVDSVHPQQNSQLPPEHREAADRQFAMMRWGKRLAPVGIPRLLFQPVATQRLRPGLQAAANARGYGSDVYETLYEEGRVFEESCEQLDSAPPISDEVMLTVLTRSEHEDWPSTVPSDEAEQAWHELQRDLAAQTPASQHSVVERSGHFVHLDQPEIVIEAIRDQIRNATHE